MHNTVKLSAVIIMICMLISACGEEYVDIKAKNFSNEAINVEIPIFKNLSDNDFEKNLNEKYEKSLTSWIDEFLKNRTEETECVFELKQSVKHGGKPIVSVIGEEYVHTEGVHGTKSRIAKNIDIDGNRELKLSDLFQDGSYVNILNREMEKITENDPEQYHDLWEKPVVSGINQEFFYLTDKSLVIFYPPYELSYYAKGFVEFFIPYENIKGYMKEEYRSL